MTVQSRSFLQPENPPHVEHPDVMRAVTWMQSVFDVMTRRLNSPSELRLEPQYVAPTKPRAGMLVYADGTSWNPGSGEGVYRFSLAAAWVYIG